ncbi:hypothetical protein DB88DRAFT_264447 [Papiliotrema laurentii]|uniref:CFEM domain-containing protein n=1 Tax=Papiliotrema laurentii TaxID=5418 RepID=A0AAD9FP20_PAPLA|nr:hypothetical protein DB88DRAFT_264447 [Papiliotrema laurentii]
MRASAVLFALLPALASAHLTSRQTPVLPDCATNCIDQLGGGCAPGDIVCYCSDPANVANVQACLPTVCSGDDLQNAQAAGLAICEAVGVSQTSLGASATAATETDAETDTATDESVSTLGTTAPTSGTNSTTARSSAGTAGVTTHAAASSVASTARPTSAAGTTATSATTGSSGNSTSHTGSANSTSTSHGAGFPAATHVVGALMGGLVVVGGAVIGF